MRFGLNVPPFDGLADPGLLADLAAEAEAVGWDGFFLWDHVYYRRPVVAALDPWIALAAAAVATSSIRLGPMVTPLARRRPQIVARQTAALDLLSDGRVVVGVGLGLDDSGAEFARFGEGTDLPRRAAIYDEALVLLTQLLSGERVNHDGEWLAAGDVQFLPVPRANRVPIWVGGRWPNRAPIKRAMRHDGLFIIDVTPGDLADVRDILSSRDTKESEFDLIVQSSDPEDASRWSGAGATWWLAAFDPFRISVDRVRRVIQRRPEIGPM